MDLDISLRDYAARWLEGLPHEKETHTVRNYTERMRGHVLPALGHLRLREIQRGHIKLFLGDKRRQGYAKNSVRLMKAALSALLSDAADDGIIPANPAFQLGRRKTARADRLTPAERLQKVRPMSWEQRDAFLAAAATGEPRYAALFAVLAKAGLRPGEGFALRVGDVDTRERTLRVERAWALGRLKGTKTYEERTVDLTPDLVHALERHITWLKAEALRCGRGEVDWLFPGEDGTPMDESRVRKVFKQALARARDCRRSGSTTHGTPMRACSWRRVRRSPASPPSSGTPTRRRRCATTPRGSPARGGGGWICWTAD